MSAAIFPILLILIAGIFLRRYLPDKGGFWEGLSWMSYWIFTPALFVTSIGSADLSIIEPGPLLFSLLIPVLAVAGLALGLGKLVRANGPQLTSLVQGSIRINTYIGLIFVSALHGSAGIASFALACAVVVPLVNIICVSALSVYGAKQRYGGKLRLWQELMFNPLILSCAGGLLINTLSIPLPGFLGSTLNMLAAPALVCGTLIAGAALSFNFRWRDVLDIGIATILKLAILPVAAMAIAIPLGVTGTSLSAIVLICAVPTAPSANVLAARMGGDTRLIAAITGTQTICALGTIPLMVAIANHFTF
ncbi:AEC family transporter [Glutamicibacter sp. NPDC087583]|uniref:AEC family transporter n=1 Tax=unclassified Glutamicibacter TaxID=2627139 RepID=UPI00380CBA7E